MMARVDLLAAVAVAVAAAVENGLIDLFISLIRVGPVLVLVKSVLVDRMHGAISLGESASDGQSIAVTKITGKHYCDFVQVSRD